MYYVKLGIVFNIIKRFEVSFLNKYILEKTNKKKNVYMTYLILEYFTFIRIQLSL